MTLHRAFREWMVGAALLLGIAASSSAQMVSVEGNTVNMRTAPSLSSEVLWQLGAGYPLKVLERKGRWVHVVDFENDRGWVSRRFVGTTPHLVVKSAVANLRSGPGTGYRVVRRAEYGEVFRVLASRKSWVRVQGHDETKGWIARRLLWGF
jgi:uncharacterized protein YgiM (DUF1202 family)